MAGTFVVRICGSVFRVSRCHICISDAHTMIYVIHPSLVRSATTKSHRPYYITKNPRTRELENPRTRLPAPLRSLRRVRSVGLRPAVRQRSILFLLRVSVPIRRTARAPCVAPVAPPSQFTLNNSISACVWPVTTYPRINKLITHSPVPNRSKPRKKSRTLQKNWLSRMHHGF